MKLTNTGTQAEKNMRGNSLTMQQRCAAENVNYWPVPIEGDGQTSKSFDSFLNKVSDYASSEGHNSQCFKNSGQQTWHAYSQKKELRRSLGEQARSIKDSHEFHHLI